MRFLADENFPGPAVAALRQQGFDVAWICEGSSGAQDEAVLARCTRESRVLLTFDKDFGELAFRRGVPGECGIVLFRVATESPEEAAAVALAVLCSGKDWPGHFSVVTPRGIRVRRLGGPLSM
jgi:predicted nuclease of predicted toxin-antitoxin system